VVGRVVELRSAEPEVVDAVDGEGVDDVGQSRRTIGHLGIMP
jgi:hypothetical protein